MHFVKTRRVQRPAQLSLQASSLYLALFFVVAALSQLFAFELYPDVLSSYGVSFVSAFALPFAALLVTLEVFAIPSLLWMTVSPLMRIVSRTSGWTVLVYWLVVGIWQGVADFTIANAGLFGAKVHLPQGWWLVSYALILLILMTYVTFGSRLSPRITKHKTRSLKNK